MERTLDELKAEMEYWQAERDRVEGLFTAARGRLWKAQSEARLNEKPTPKMLDVLAKLAHGYTIRESRWRHPYSYFLEASTGRGERVVSRVFDGIDNRGCLERKKDGARDYTYTITAWGREVLAKAARKGAE